MAEMMHMATGLTSKHLMDRLVTKKVRSPVAYLSTMWENFTIYAPYYDTAGWLIELIVFHIPDHDLQVIRYNKNDYHLAVKFDTTIRHMSTGEFRWFLKTKGLLNEPNF